MSGLVDVLSGADQAAIHAKVIDLAAKLLAAGSHKQCEIEEECRRLALTAVAGLAAADRALCAVGAITDSEVSRLQIDLSWGAHPKQSGEAP